MGENDENRGRTRQIEGEICTKSFLKKDRADFPESFAQSASIHSRKIGAHLDSAR
jgi:hypothetical protein